MSTQKHIPSPLSHLKFPKKPKGFNEFFCFLFIILMKKIDLHLKKYSKENLPPKQNINNDPIKHQDMKQKKPIPSILTKIDSNINNLFKINALSEKNNQEIFNKFQKDQTKNSSQSHNSSRVSEYLQTEVLFQKKTIEKLGKTSRISTVRSSSSNTMKNKLLYLNTSQRNAKKNDRYKESLIENKDKLVESLKNEAINKLFYSNNEKNVMLFKKEIFKESPEIYKNSKYTLINSKELLDFFKYSMKMSISANNFINELEFWKNIEEFIKEEELSNRQKFYQKNYKFLRNLNEKNANSINKSCEFSNTASINKSCEINKNNKNCLIF